MFHISQFADKLQCIYCGKMCDSPIWPVSGDHFPFYYQKETGNYTLPIPCSHCGKEWFVVWDDNPGPMHAVV